jgi:hypothetical protein
MASAPPSSLQQSDVRQQQDNEQALTDWEKRMTFCILAAGQSKADRKVLL